MKLYTQNKLLQIIFGLLFAALVNITTIHFHLAKVSPQQQLNMSAIMMVVALILSLFGPRVTWFGVGLALHSLLTGSVSDMEIMRITVTQQIFFAVLYFLIIISIYMNYNENNEKPSTLPTPTTNQPTTKSKPKKSTNCPFCGSQYKPEDVNSCSNCGGPKLKENED